MGKDKMTNSVLPGMESEILVGGSELAEWLCVTPSAVTRMSAAGRLEPLPGGQYPLKRSVQAIITEMRGRKTHSAEKKDLDRSLKYWQVETAKQKVLSWRLQYGKELALSIITQLDGALAELQRRTGSDPNINGAILALSQSIKAVRVDDVVYGMDEEDPDEFASSAT